QPEASFNPLRYVRISLKAHRQRRDHTIPRVTIEVLKKALTAQPFTPFELRITNGDAAEVPHPEFVFIHPESPRTIVVAEEGGVRVLDLLHIAEIRYVVRPRRRRAG